MFLFNVFIQEHFLCDAVCSLNCSGELENEMNKVEVQNNFSFGQDWEDTDSSGSEDEGSGSEAEGATGGKVKAKKETKNVEGEKEEEEHDEDSDEEEDSSDGKIFACADLLS